jgi:F-type H+-transporting ATPase subunit gamma
MPVNAKAVKARINSAKNTKKITKAMELVSAAKMRKAVQAANATRSYANLMRELLVSLSHVDEPNTPLLEIRPINRVLVLLVSSNRGLCGSYNANTFKKLGRYIDNKRVLKAVKTRDGDDVSTDEEPIIEIIGVGRKSALFAKRNNLTLSAVFDDLSEKPEYEDVLPIADIVINGFKEKKYDKVMLAYTHFKSSLNQEATIKQLLPLSPEDLTKVFGEEEGEEHTEHTESIEISNIEEYVFEPGIEDILNVVAPKLMSVQIYHAILDSAASEHSARMVAMKNATDNAGELIKELTMAYNKARQAAITQEIAEIAGGAAALS